MQNYELSSLLIPRTITILQAIQQLNAVDARVLLVLDQGGKLFGILTEGDIRKAIYKGASFSSLVEDVCNRDFKYLTTNDKEAALSIYNESPIRSIPVLNEDGRVQDIIFLDEILETIDSEIAVSKVVIMAGGRGSRLLPITNIIPKPLLPVKEKPIIELIMDSFFKQGCKDFVLSLNYKKDFIKSYFAEQNLPYNLKYYEEDFYMGTAGSLALMKDFLTGPFFLTNCDILVNMNYKSAYRTHKKQDNSITIIGVLKEFSIPYGVINMQDGVFQSIDEKPELHYIVNSGVYIIESTALELISIDTLRQTEFHMTDLINKAKQAGLNVGVYPAYRNWIDIGQWNEYSEILKN